MAVHQDSESLAGASNQSSSVYGLQGYEGISSWRVPEQSCSEL